MDYHPWILLHSSFKHQNSGNVSCSSTQLASSLATLVTWTRVTAMTQWRLQCSCLDWQMKCPKGNPAAIKVWLFRYESPPKKFSCYVRRKGRSKMNKRRLQGAPVLLLRADGDKQSYELRYLNIYLHIIVLHFFSGFCIIVSAGRLMASSRAQAECFSVLDKGALVGRVTKHMLEGRPGQIMCRREKRRRTWALEHGRSIGRCRKDSPENLGLRNLNLG